MRRAMHAFWWWVFKCQWCVYGMCKATWAALLCFHQVWSILYSVHLHTRKWRVRMQVWQGWILPVTGADILTKMISCSWWYGVKSLDGPFCERKIFFWMSKPARGGEITDPGVMCQRTHMLGYSQRTSSPVLDRVRALWSVVNGTPIVENEF